MKRFRWPLQRLLEVTAQRELALRAELSELRSRIDVVRAEIAARRDAIRRLLEDLARADFAARISRQQIVLSASAVEERKIGRLSDRLSGLRADHREKTEQFLKTRTSRRTLERLRDEAERKYRKERTRFEQKRLDDAAAGSFARKMLPAWTSGD